MKCVIDSLRSSLTLCAVSIAIFSNAKAADDSSLDQLFGPAPEAGSQTDVKPAGDAAAPPQAAPVAEAPAAEAPAPIAAAPASAEAAPESAAGQPAEAAKAKKSSGRLVEEIIVTAQKREESLIAVPIAVQAFTPGALEARGITNTAGLMRATPGLDIGSNAGFTTIFLRGVGTEAFLTADPSIANYIDGVYFPFSPSFSQEFGAVTRVEVLKGPQGTLFGRNAVGGAINVLTKEPNFSDSEFSGSSSYGNFNARKISAYANVPLSETTAINFSGFYSAASSYFTGSTNGEDANNPAILSPLRLELTSGAKIKFRWKPIDDVDVLLGVTKSYGQNNSDFPINLHPRPLGTLLGVPAAGHYAGHTDTNLYLNSEITVYQFEVRYHAPWFDTKVLGSKQSDTQPFNYDFDGSIQPLVSFNIKGHSADIHESEIQFLSNHDTPFSDWLTVTSGVYYFDNIQGFHPIDVTVANLNPAGPRLNGVTIPGVLGSALNSTFGVGGPFGPGGALNNLFPGLDLSNPYYNLEDQALAKTRSLSEYIQLTTKFTDWASMTVGFRYQDEYRGVADSSTGIKLTATSTEFTVLPWTTARDQNGNSVPNNHKTKRLTPKLAFDFHPFQDDTLIYLSYQQAVKAHAYNTYAIYLPPEYVKAEKTTAYEVGFKGRLFDDNLTYSAAAFRYNIKDLQTQFVSLVNGGAVSFENAGPAKIEGMDFDFTTKIFPSLVDGLDLSLNGCWLESAKYLDYVNGSGFNKTTGIFGNTNNYTGDRITRSPKYTASTAITKTFQVPGGSLELGSDFYFNDGYWLSASNDPVLEQKAYSTIGAHVSYEYDPWHMTATFGGTNITSRFYTAGVIGTDFGTNYHVAPPVQYAFTLKWSL